MKKIIYILSVFVAFVSCESNPYIKDVSNTKVELTVHDFHSDLYSKKESLNQNDISKFRNELGLFFESYNARILQIGLSSDSTYVQKITDFLLESWVRDLYESVQKNFPNSDFVQTELTKAFTYYAYYFPEKSIPQVATFVGGVQYSVVLDSNMIAIGLDKYLGSKFPMYQQMNIASFIRKGMYKDKIAVDCMRAIAESEFPTNFTDDNLLSAMIENGRYMYFVKSMVPEVADSTLWGYSAKQIAYCEQSEAEFWEYFRSVDNVLFSSDYLIKKRFIDPGPFTPVFDRESPGGIGQWMGFKIVESFMKNNPDVTLAELFKITDSQQIMNNAKYNP